MDIAYQLARYLDDANFGTLGTDIFAGQIPAEINGLYVIRTGGTLEYHLPIEETVLDIYCKNTSSEDCITTLENIKRFIHRMHTTVKGDAYIYSMLVIGDVEDVQRDLEYAKIYKITVLVRHRNTSIIS